MSEKTVSNSPKKIFIVDDHPLVRQGLRDFINHDDGLTVCGEAASRKDALSFIGENTPDIMLIDLSLGEDSGLDLIKDVTVNFPKVKMLVLSMQDELLYAERVLRAGASGYLTKDADPKRLIQAVHTVLDGGFYASENVTQKILRSRTAKAADDGSDPIGRLSDQELTVFERIGNGKSTAEIAEQMGLSIKTIETYRSRIKNKLGLTSSAELVQRAVQHASGI